MTADTKQAMCDEIGAALGGNRASHNAPGPSGSHTSSYECHGYDSKGNKWSKKKTRHGASWREMQEYVNSESDGGYNRRDDREHVSPFGRSAPGQSRRDELEYYPDDPYYANDAPDYGLNSGAPASLLDAALAAPPVTAAAQKDPLEWDITKESGMVIPLSVHFAGSPAQFAAKAAPIAPGRSDRGDRGDSLIDKVKPCDPGVFHFSGKDLHNDLRVPSRTKRISEEAAQIAQMTQKNKQLLPLGVTVRDYHNPFSFPVGVSSSIPALNTVRFKNSAQKYMIVLMPGSNHSGAIIDLRPDVDVGRIRMAACLTNEDITAQCRPSGNRAPGLVMVERDSMLHDTIVKLHEDKRITPVDWSATNEVSIYGGTFIDGIPKASAAYALDRLVTIQNSKNGKVSVDDVSFTLHPLNFQGKWDGHHLSGASFEQLHAPEVYTEFMNRAVDVSVNMDLAYL